MECPEHRLYKRLAAKKDYSIIRGQRHWRQGHLLCQFMYKLIRTQVKVTAAGVERTEGIYKTMMMITVEEGKKAARAYTSVTRMMA